MIVFDLDGTLSIVGDRLKYLQQKSKDWDAFYEHCNEDAVNTPIANIFKRLLLYTSSTIVIVTGRRESVRQKTLDWINNVLLKEGNFHFPSDYLFMRKDGDFRHDTIVKPELVKDFIGAIELVFEDRKSMVDKWRELDITCCQVAEGDF